MKQYVMEFLGTFFVTIAISLIGNPIAIGLMLMAMIYVGGHISGAHYNPAISFACFVQNRLQLTEMGMYIAAQLLGATAALCFFMMITNNSFILDMVPGSSVVGPMSIELLLVLVLCWVYLTMNVTNRYKDTAISGIVIGLTLMAIASIGSIFNPAVAAASVLCNIIQEGSFNDFSSLIVYIVGPLVGGLGGSVIFNYFKSEL
ncbi:MAG TPA: aquaporin [Candidatus Babeliales bacterium]|nr:aquaporin [Candidatus Babeliales bacterium]